MAADFVHLHCHTQFSMLDGSIRLKGLVKQVAEMGMGAIAVTDHANMFGAVQLHNACNNAGVKPIIGCEVNLVGGARDDDQIRDHHHLVLLASSQEGYQNLVRIVSRGWVEGLVQGVPRVDFELLREHRNGVVGMSACMGGYLAQQILRQGPAAGRSAMATLRDSFDPGYFFVEIQDHGFPEQGPLNEILVELAGDLDVPVVASNDCHYPTRQDAHSQLVLQCIGASRSLEEMERLHHGSDEIFLKSPEEMIERFSHLPEAISNTLRVAEMCAGTVNPLSAPKLPAFQLPDGVSESDHLREISKEGLDKRIASIDGARKKSTPKLDRKAYEKRLQIELDVIIEMGFPGYFLIVQDFIRWAKENDVPVGPGRGSGAGSLVAYSLDITNLDPLPYGLLFERFLNPERVSMPDFDIDFCMNKRDMVIDYVRDKYGRSSVGQIATFHLLKSRSVVRDVGRVMGFTPADAGRLATLVPEPIGGKSVPVKEALEQEPRLKAQYDEEPQVKRLLDTAMNLEDLTRHAGMHAAGVVISEGPLWDHVPVFCPEPNTYVTQYDKNDVEAAGLVKFDFLGLRTLTVIDVALKLIDKRPDREGQTFDIDKLPMDDAATFALLQSGETTNVFQLESSGMQTLFKQLKPDCFEDIVAAVALYRPGPLGTGMVEDFVQRKHGRTKVEYPHPCLEETLRETYGVIVYQEQVMQIAREMGGYSLGGADILRRAMGKKKAEEMEKQKTIFTAGAVEKSYGKEDAERVFELMAYFAGYGFNKSHSAAYALITYQTAYLKAHYPVEFVAATLSADKDKTEKVVRTVAEARSMGITVLPPDVNQSAIDFTAVYQPDTTGKVKKPKRTPVCQKGKVRDPLGPRIRFGLGGVRGVGESALDAIFEERSGRATWEREGRQGEPKKEPFADLFDLAARVDLRRVNKNVCVALVQCGGFDALHEPKQVSRAMAAGAVEAAIERGKKLTAERNSGQTNLFNLFGGGDDEAAKALSRGGTFSKVEPWDTRELLAKEKQTLGFYVSGHPLDRYATELRRMCNATTESLSEIGDGTQVTVGGSVEGYRERTTKTGRRIAFFDLEDPQGRVEVIVRPRVLSNDTLREVLQSGEPIIAVGTLQHERDRGSEDGATEAKILLDQAHLLAESLKRKTTSVLVRLPVDDLDRLRLEALKQCLMEHPGGCPVTIELAHGQKWTVSLVQTGISVEPADALLAGLERIFGGKVCELR